MAHLYYFLIFLLIEIKDDSFFRSLNREKCFLA